MCKALANRARPESRRCPRPGGGGGIINRDFGGWEGDPCPRRTVRIAASRQRDSVSAGPKKARASAMALISQILPLWARIRAGGPGARGKEGGTG